MLTTPEERATPAEIRKKSGEGITIRWADGHVSLFGARYLRGRCPCAQCVSESTGRRLVFEEHVAPEVSIEAARTVGNYALHFSFSDGHTTGIYSFDYLRRICPCAACAGDRGGRLRATKVTFAPSAGELFVAEVKERVADYFRSRAISPAANTEMIVKTCVMLGVTLWAYALILSNQFSAWPMLGLAILMGFGVAGIGFNIAHDALHGAYSSNNRINKIFGFTFELVGASGYMWKITHNVIHHTYPNVHGLDEDLEVSPLLRLSPEAEHRPIHRFQHWYAFAAYSVTTLFWVFLKDFKYFLKRDLGPLKGRKHSLGQVLTLIGTKLFYYSYMIVIPLLVLDVLWWQFVIGFVAMHLTAGLVLGIVFQLAHVVEDTEHPMPDVDGAMESAWMVHQMETTSNFANSNRLITWYVGGLNHQVEHHLFPKICSVHYPALSRIVRGVAEKHGIPYHQHDTFRAAVASHLRTLKRLGRGATSMIGAHE